MMMWSVPSIFSGYSSIHRKIITAIPNHLIFNAKNAKIMKRDFY